MNGKRCWAVCREPCPTVCSSLNHISCDDIIKVLDDLTGDSINIIYVCNFSREINFAIELTSHSTTHFYFIQLLASSFLRSNKRWFKFHHGKNRNRSLRSAIADDTHTLTQKVFGSNLASVWIWCAGRKQTIGPVISTFVSTQSSCQLEANGVSINALTNTTHTNTNYAGITCHPTMFTHYSVRCNQRINRFELFGNGWNETAPKIRHKTIW